jgi:hypothetical protein
MIKFDTFQTLISILNVNIQHVSILFTQKFSSRVSKAIYFLINLQFIRKTPHTIALVYIKHWPVETIFLNLYEKLNMLRMLIKHNGMLARKNIFLINYSSIDCKRDLVTAVVSLDEASNCKRFEIHKASREKIMKFSSSFFAACACYTPKFIWDAFEGGKRYSVPA